MSREVEQLEARVAGLQAALERIATRNYDPPPEFPEIADIRINEGTYPAAIAVGALIDFGGPFPERARRQKEWTDKAKVLADRS